MISPDIIMRLSFLEKEAMTDIILLCAEHGWNVECQKEIVDKSKYQGCSIEDKPYKRNICSLEYGSHYCNTCKWAYYHQKDYLKYILDFSLTKGNKKIDLELDGLEFHKHRKSYDAQRDNYMEGRGWKVLRINSYMVFKKKEEFIKMLEDNLKR